MRSNFQRWIKLIAMKSLSLSALTVIVALLLISSCELESPNTTPERDNPLDQHNPITNGDPFQFQAQIAGGGIQITWLLVNVPSVVGYNLYRKVDDNYFDLFQELNGQNTAAYTDFDIQNGHKYSYYLAARTSHGEESTSNTAQVVVNSTPIMSIDDQSGFTSARIVYITLLSYGADSMQVALPDFSSAAWEAYTTYKAIVLPPGPGVKVVHVRFKYPVGVISPIVSDQTMPFPIEPNFVINDDSTYTWSRQVGLNLTANNALWMRIYNDSTMGTSLKPAGNNAINKNTTRNVNEAQSRDDDWIPFSNYQEWTLLPGPGTKKVFVDFKDDFDNIETDSDEIIPSLMNPNVVINDNAEFTIARQVALNLTANNALWIRAYNGSNSGLSPQSSNHLANDKSAARSVNAVQSADEDWITFTNYLNWTLLAGPGTKKVYVDFKDDFDNIETDSDEINPNPMNPNFVINDDSTYTWSRQVGLNLSANNALWIRAFNDSTTGKSINRVGTIRGSKSTERRSSNAQSADDEWIPFANYLEWTLLSGPGTKKVYVDFKDDFDNIETVSDEISPVPMNPNLNIQPDSTYINYAQVWLSMPGVAASEMKLSNSLDSSAISWQPFTEPIYNWNLDAPDGLKHVYAWFKNDFYAEAPVSDSVWLDTYCEVDAFYWTSSAGDTLYAGDQLTVHLLMKSDVIGSETGGLATVNLGNWLVDSLLHEDGGGNYSGTYTVQSSDWVSNATLTLNFTDRAGNTITLYDTSKSVSVFGSMHPYEVTYIGGWYDPPIRVTLSGNYAYVADSWSGLRIIDITNPGSSWETGSSDTPDNARDVRVSGNYAYVADGDSGLRIIDISNSASPFEVGFYDTPGYACGVAVSGNYAYVADNGTGLRIIDVSNPTNPQEVGYYDTPDYAQDVAVLDNYAYVADGWGGLRITNVSNPVSPVEIGVQLPYNYIIAVAILGNYAYIADGYSGLHIINISDPTNSYEVGSYNTWDSSDDVCVVGDYAYLAARGAGLRIVDISNPANPIEAGVYTYYYGNGVAVSGDYTYLVDGGYWGYLHIINLWGSP